MENVTLQGVLAVIGWVFGGIILLRNGANAISDIIKAAKAPNDAQDKRLKELEDNREHVDDCLRKDKKAIEDLDKVQRITLRAQLALLSHGLDGNNVDRMKKSKDEIEEYLLER